MGGMWLYNKGKHLVENPEQFIAETMVKANPDLELISVDKVAQEVIIKDKKTGQSLTFSFADLKAGKFHATRSDGSRIEVGPNGVRVIDKDGKEQTPLTEIPEPDPAAAPDADAAAEPATDPLDGPSPDEVDPP